MRVSVHCYYLRLRKVFLLRVNLFFGVVTEFVVVFSSGCDELEVIVFVLPCMPVILYACMALEGFNIYY